MKKKTCYITTPIYYASGAVHIGNSYSTIICDAYARYNRMKGNDTFYLTGMDEHGLKIEESAKKEGKTPLEFVDNIASKTSSLWKTLNISNDDFIRTSEVRHKKVVQKIFDKLLKQGDIYLGEYEGNYCVSCESFFTKTQLNDDGTCPDCGKHTSLVKEKSYFLNLKKYQKRLLDFIKENPNCIQPETRRNEVVSFIEGGLEDLCVSRTTINWGIPVLTDPKHVVYVWIDALTNYISALGYETEDDSLFQKYWINGDKIAHVIGKDILRFHAIYWPIILMALDIPLNFTLYAHGWILMKDAKMSKSRGNIIYPTDVSERYGLDALRYYLVKEMPLGNDGLFTWERFIERYNVELANDLGNLVSRTISMINKYFNGRVYKPKKKYFEFDDELEKMIEDKIEIYKESFDNFRFQDGLNAIWDIVGRSNKYIDQTMPWVLAKDEKEKEKLNDVLYHLYEVLRIVSIAISPVMIESSNKISFELGLEEEERRYDKLKYGVTKDKKVSEKIEILFKRLDKNKELEDLKS